MTEKIKFPFTVGDILYDITESLVNETRIESIIYTPLPEGEYMFEINMEDGYNSWDIGKVIFFSKKDAEKTLKERICNGTVL
jgi:hypothetical protein